MTRHICFYKYFRKFSVKFRVKNKAIVYSADWPYPVNSRHYRIWRKSVQSRKRYAIQLRLIVKINFYSDILSIFQVRIRWFYELSTRKSLQLSRMISAIHKTLHLLYTREEKQISIAMRNSEIYQRYEAGETLKNLAYSYGISLQRVHQIVPSVYTQSTNSSRQ